MMRNGVATPQNPVPAVENPSAVRACCPRASALDCGDEGRAVTPLWLGWPVASFLGRRESGLAAIVSRRERSRARRNWKVPPTRRQGCPTRMSAPQTLDRVAKAFQPLPVRGTFQRLCRRWGRARVLASGKSVCESKALTNQGNRIVHRERPPGTLALPPYFPTNRSRLSR